MTNTHRLLAAIVFIAGLGSCDVQDEKIPSYVYVDKFSFTVRPGEGTAHQNLTDGWITINSHYYGAYELPAWIPVLEEGPCKLFLVPGYRQNGSISNTFQYALLEPYSDSIFLTARKTDTIRPVTGYQAGLYFSIFNFDGATFLNSQDRDGDVETTVQLSTNAESFEGSNSGLIELNSAHPYLFAEDRLNNLIIPQSVDPIILELNFKSDIPFSIGLVGYKGSSQQPEDHLDAHVLPKNVWTKVYFDFQSIVNLSNSDYYHLAIKANFDPANSLAVQRILIDNIKVIHR